MNALEDELIRKIAADGPSAAIGRQLTLGIGDDAALFTAKRGHQTVLTCDWFLEGTHFLRDKHPADAVGWKCLARALSDIAAMGGQPRCFLLSLALPKKLTGRWLTEFLTGLKRAAARFSCPLVGGDTTPREQVLINVTAVGEVRSGRAILRSGAREGDLIYVSGFLGEAALGLHLLRKSKARHLRANRLLKKHLYPEPRLALGKWLADKGIATAMIDISDGLSTDLYRLCSASGVGALLDSDGFPVPRVPTSLRRRLGDPLNAALHGGDDYELLFTVRRGKLPTLPWRWSGIPIHPIGHITSGPNVVFHVPFPNESKSLILRPGGWDPFRQSPSASPPRRTSTSRRHHEP